MASNLISYKAALSGLVGLLAGFSVGSIHLGTTEPYNSLSVRYDELRGKICVEDICKCGKFPVEFLEMVRIESDLGRMRFNYLPPFAFVGAGSGLVLLGAGTAAVDYYRRRKEHQYKRR